MHEVNLEREEDNFFLHVITKQCNVYKNDGYDFTPDEDDDVPLGTLDRSDHVIVIESMHGYHKVFSRLGVVYVHHKCSQNYDSFWCGVFLDCIR